MPAGKLYLMNFKIIGDKSGKTRQIDNSQKLKLIRISGLL